MATMYDRISSALGALGKRRDREEEGTPGGDAERGASAAKQRHTLGSYNPFDQAALHARLLTFKPLNWFAKPDCCSPVECACHGWQNDERDALRWGTHACIHACQLSSCMSGGLMRACMSGMHIGGGHTCISGAGMHAYRGRACMHIGRPCRDL